jgi:hypothetical protein
MKIKKTAVIFCCFLQLSSCWPAYSQQFTYEKNARYEVKYEGFDGLKWVFLESIFHIIGYRFLDWEEMAIKTVVLKNLNNLDEKVMEISLTPDNEKVMLSITDSADAEKNFIKIIKIQNLKSGSARELLRAWNYLYEDNEKDFELNISSNNLFTDESGSMHCKFTKKKEGGKYLVTARTFNKNGENSKVEIIVNPVPEPLIEKITGQLKSREKIIFTLTKKP